MLEQAELLEPRQLGPDRRRPPREVALLREPPRPDRLAGVPVALHDLAEYEGLPGRDLHAPIVARAVHETARDVEVVQVELREPGDREERRAELRLALARRLGRDPAEIRLVSGPHGKPALADPVEGLHFSSSSSGHCCLIAITTVGPVGVDVEKVVPRTHLDRIAETRFASDETAAIMSLEGEARLRAFYNCWTRKEAYLKATGTGLTAPLDRVVVSVDDERPAIVALEGGDPAKWSVASLEPRPGYVAAVVWRDRTG